MNKVKMFFIAATLVLTTAGVFAGKARFANPTNLWLYEPTSGVAKQITTGAPVSGNFNAAVGNIPAPLTASVSGSTYYLYQIVSGVYTPVKTTF